MMSILHVYEQILIPSEVIFFYSDKMYDRMGYLKGGCDGVEEEKEEEWFESQSSCLALVDTCESLLICLPRSCPWTPLSQ